jgi:hypothetical protein
LTIIHTHTHTHTHKLETAEKSLRESDEQLTAFIAKPEGVAVSEKKRQVLAARAAAEKVRKKNKNKVLKKMGENRGKKKLVGK